MVEDALADAQALGRDLEQLVVREELQTLLQTQLARRHEAQRVVRAGGAGIGQLLFLADVDGDILLLRRHADDHAGIHGHARADEQLAALLRIVQAVGDALAGLERDERAGIAAAEVALVRGVAVKDGGHDALALRVGHELVAVAEQAARRHEKLQPRALADGLHLLQLTLAGAELFDHGADRIGRDVRDEALDRLALLAVDRLVEHARGRDLELIAFAAHGLDEDGQRHLAAAGDVERIGRALEIGHAQGHVLERLAVEPLADLAAGDEFALAAGKRAVVDGEGHLHRGRGDLDKLDRLDAARRADRVADGDVADAGHGDDAAGLRLRDGHALQALELIHGHGLGLLGRRIRLVVVAHGDLLVLADDAALDTADGDAADKLVVVDGRHEHLERRVDILFRRGDVLQDRLEQRAQILARHIRGVGRGALTAGAEKHGRVKLLVGGVEVHEQLQHLVDDLVDALVGAVDLVDDDDDAVAELERLAEHEARLRHGTLGGIHEQDDAVDHLQDTLDLAAEIGVTRRVDDVDLRVAVAHGGVLGQDRDAALALQIVGVHDALDDFLMLTVCTALLEHFVDQRGLAVVNVGDDGDVSQFLHFAHFLKENHIF